VARTPQEPDQTRNGCSEIPGNFTQAQWRDVTRRARRIWEGIRVHKQATSGVDVPTWEKLDSAQRETMLSLAAESLGLQITQ
jgi:hypothetical protein